MLGATLGLCSPAVGALARADADADADAEAEADARDGGDVATAAGVGATLGVVGGLALGVSAAYLLSVNGIGVGDFQTVTLTWVVLPMASGVVGGAAGAFGGSLAVGSPSGYPPLLAGAGAAVLATPGAVCVGSGFDRLGETGGGCEQTCNALLEGSLLVMTGALVGCTGILAGASVGGATGGALASPPADDEVPPPPARGPRTPAAGRPVGAPPPPPAPPAPDGDGTSDDRADDPFAPPAPLEALEPPAASDPADPIDPAGRSAS